ncbi:MAG: VWA-like domain-containing protein [Bacteroidota bacterium]
MKPDMDADYYYRFLLDLYHKMTEEEKGSDGQGSGQGNSGQNSSGGSEGQQGGAGSGSGGQNSDEDRNESWENLKKMLGDSTWGDMHGLWEELDEMPTSLRDIVEQAVDRSIVNTLERTRRSSNTWGSLPSALRSYLDEFEQSLKPSVSWKRLLRMFAESSSRTYLKNTMKRRSRRYGTTPGIKVRRRQRLVVAVDTSGSIGKEDLQEFFNEIYHIWKRGAEIMIVECDATVTATYLYKGKVPEGVHGGGGTDFNPPIDWANQNFHPDALIYFTDGYAPPPTVRPRYPLLWLLCSSSSADSASVYHQNLPGKMIKMQPLAMR